MLSTDILDVLLDENGDIALGSDGSVLFAIGPSGVAQCVGVACKIVMGELFCNLDIGVPYFERVGVVTPDQALLGQPFDQQKAHDAIAAVILTAPAIVAVGALAVTYDGAARAVSITGSATYQFDDTPPGQIDVDVQVAA